MEKECKCGAMMLHITFANKAKLAVYHCKKCGRTVTEPLNETIKRI